MFIYCMSYAVFLIISKTNKRGFYKRIKMLKMYLNTGERQRNRKRKTERQRETKREREKGKKRETNREKERERGRECACCKEKVGK